jgi:hypothetical protein
MKIVFTDTSKLNDEFAPTPAGYSIPEWYKKLESYIGNKKKPTGHGDSTATIKRCMPVFDAITNGYIIYTYADIYVKQNEIYDKETNLPTGKTGPWFEWPISKPIEFHAVEQAPTIPGRSSYEGALPKFINPWSVKTPKGYSCLFTQPMHRDLPFTILPGVVDTDVYTQPVNFPFVLNDWTFEGLIPGGTPVAQVIPFKRESWKMEFGKDENRLEAAQHFHKIKTSFFDAYKIKFRQHKEYK